MIHPDTGMVFVSDEIGLGVVATASLPRGTIVWAQDRFDVEIPLQTYRELDAAHRAVVDRYAHLDAGKNRILCWDAGRYVNHDCRPSLRGVGSTMMIATRDLAPGDAITCDYAECNLDETLRCSCGAPTCREYIRREDLVTFAPAWDEEVRFLCQAARQVPQPLWPYLRRPDETRALIWGYRTIPSFAHIYGEGLDAMPPSVITRTSL